MATFTPNWSESTVVAAAVLARGSVASGTLDLRAKFGARLLACIGRGGTTALSNGVNLRVRPTINANTTGHPGGYNLLSTGAVAASSTTVDADSAAGQKVLNVAATTGFAAGDTICIQDSGGGVTRLEWATISLVTAGVSLTVDRNLEFAHTAAQADTVRNKGDAFLPLDLPGGAIWEVIFDYGDDATGESVTVRAIAQVYDSDSSSA